jgi:tRNA A-37 threonylcarbamoyl transferase component Bud32
VVKTLKELKGHSASHVSLMQDDDKIFVRKTGDIARNLERYDVLSNYNINLPKIYEIYGNYYDMEYISCLEMKKYLSFNKANKLVDFIQEIVYNLSKNTYEKDYTETYRNKLSKFDFTKFEMPFTADELIDKLPKILPASEYHGDFTLENILYDTKNDKFVLIDPLTTEFDSFVFDLAKLRQDLVCKWFIRNDDVYLDSKLYLIIDKLNNFVHNENHYLLILMLMRVLPYTTNEKDKEYLMREVRRLWK